MKSTKVKILKIVALIVVSLMTAIFFIANSATKGIGDSLENEIKGLRQVSNTIDAVDLAKVDSLKQALSQEFDSVKTSKKEFSNEIVCSESGCEGTYIGPEFVDGADIAHQFSNKMAGKVGNKLKELYAKMKFSKVTFSKIKMSTDGMSSGSVVYKLRIPFENVNEKCEAYTSFDHVGGWNHKPALERRKAELSGVLIDGQTFDISDLKTTPEGLQEYWIQWKNKITQSTCK